MVKSFGEGVPEESEREVVQHTMTFPSKQNKRNKQQSNIKAARANRIRRARQAPIARPQAAPVARSRLTRTRAPSVRTRLNSASITHREYIGDVNGTVAFAANSFAVNPGNPAVFPWLSQIAQRYESYVFHSLHFEFETVASTLTAGSVLMACDYDAADAAPADKQTLMSYAQATRGAPWQESRFSARSSDLTKFSRERYVRDANTPSGDIKTYDVANFFLATQGMADTSAIGELYVSYNVELRTPQLTSATPALSIEYAAISTTSTSAAFFNTVITERSTGLVVTYPTTNSVTLAGLTIGGHYKITSRLDGGTSAGAVGFNYTGASSVPGADLVVNGGDVFNVSLGESMATAYFSPTATSVTFTCSSLPTTTQPGDFEVSRIPVYTLP